MGNEVTKLGKSKISAKGQIQLIANALPFLGNPQPGDYIEFHLIPEKPNEIVLRKRSSKKSSEQ